MINYIPINYELWDFSGKGNNILSSLNSIERKIWDKALSLQDKRDDLGHAEVVTYFALKFLGFYPNAKREIVTPASILHDTGWNIDGKKFREIITSGNEKEMRLEHQVRGSLIAYEILNQINYSTKNILEIMKIILNHDTRITEHNGNEFYLSENEKIVRDADVLWRFTKPCMDNYNKGKSKQELREIMNKEFAKNNLYSIFSKEIAKIEMHNTLKSVRK